MAFVSLCLTRFTRRNALQDPPCRCKRRVSFFRAAEQRALGSKRRLFVSQPSRAGAQAASLSRLA